VSTEVVSLGLNQVGRHTLGPVPIEEGEGTAESWSGDTQGDGGSHHLPPGVLNSENIEQKARSQIILAN